MNKSITVVLNGYKRNHLREQVEAIQNQTVPVKEIIDLGKKWGTKHFIIEQESYQGKQPLDCVKEDLGIMKKWGY